MKGCVIQTSEIIYWVVYLCIFYIKSGFQILKVDYTSGIEYALTYYHTTYQLLSCIISMVTSAIVDDSKKALSGHSFSIFFFKAKDKEEPCWLAVIGQLLEAVLWLCTHYIFTAFFYTTSSICIYSLVPSIALMRKLLNRYVTSI